MDPDCYNFLFGNISVNFTSSFARPNWRFPPCFVILMSTFALPINAIVLWIFYREKRLITSFTVYIIALLVCNLTYVIIKQTVDIITDLYCIWPLGQVVCDIYKYYVYGFAGVILHLHALITANRIWAVNFPLSYRNYHTKHLAIVLCVAVTLYTHVICLPGILMDIMHHR